MKFDFEGSTFKCVALIQFWLVPAGYSSYFIWNWNRTFSVVTKMVHRKKKAHNMKYKHH